ncbi:MULTISPECIES: hypothetical protein [Nitrosopumilus]|uniref:Uncharacterized protein n=1 Tax=Nitrosopumilus piranensis TaxID=1582439 RepID=A0A0C5BZ67_9ARCH|nr:MULTISPECIES: hypothetical protein [Nitrosopumilus]AJM92295.1 hypothetical protein NPIRD3C_1083 [Nitrosopumilus piranensis]KAF6244237.1 hypothetical protein C6989_08040 [Nitrosopumilus sp. b2]
MRKLLDPHHDYLKTEENVKKYLNSLSDSQLKLYFEAIEFTPFPLMLIQEYSKRFSKNRQKTRK